MRLELIGTILAAEHLTRQANVFVISSPKPNGPVSDALRAGPTFLLDRSLELEEPAVEADILGELGVEGCSENLTLADCHD